MFLGIILNVGGFPFSIRTLNFSISSAEGPRQALQPITDNDMKDAMTANLMLDTR